MQNISNCDCENGMEFSSDLKNLNDDQNENQEDQKRPLEFLIVDQDLKITIPKSQSTSPLPSQSLNSPLDTIIETSTCPIDSEPNSKQTLKTSTNPVYRRGRNRADSIRQFTDKVRSFSIDLLRSIENAQEMIDLKNSNFSAATQSAAAHAAQHHQHQSQIYDQDTNFLSTTYNNSVKRKSPFNTSNCTGESRTVSSVSRSNQSIINDSSDQDIKEQDIAEKIESPKKSIQFSRPIDEINAQDDYRRSVNNENENRNIKNRVFYQVNNFDQNGKLEDFSNFSEIKGNSKKNLKEDKVDFRAKKRFIFKNGSKKSIPDDIHISILEVFIYLWGVVTFFADLISDIILSKEYFDNSRMWLAFMTLMFVVVPNVTLSLFSLSWYIDKYYSEKQLQELRLKQEEQTSMQHDVNKSQNKNTACDSITFWLMTILFVVFQLDLVLKYIQGFIYTLKGWACRSLFHNLKWEKYYIEKQIKCDTDIGMLRLIDVFLDSGPQVLLQLYVLTTQNLNEVGSANLVVITFKDFKTTSIEIKQLVSILSSLFSMGYALAGYHRCLRNQQFIFCLETNKPLPRPMQWISTIMQFLWYLFLIAPRVLSMSIFASTFRSWFFMIVFTHWLIMYFWILRLKTNYCITSQDVYSAREEIFEKFYDLVCSFIYIFVYFNLKAGPTRIRYLIYYFIFYTENILFCTCYFLFSKETNFAYKLIMLLIVVFGFWIAITFQLVYYLHCHPSHNIRVCVRKKTEFHFIHKETLKPTDFYDFSLTEGDDGEEEEEEEERDKNKEVMETGLQIQQVEDFQKKIAQPEPTDLNSLEVCNEVLRTLPKNLIIDSTKTSSSCSSFANENENSASMTKLLKSGSITVESNMKKDSTTNSTATIKRKKTFFKNNFTQFLNLYSSTNSTFSPHIENLLCGHVAHRPDYIHLSSAKKDTDDLELIRRNNSELNRPIVHDTTTLLLKDDTSPLSIQSISSFSSYTSIGISEKLQNNDNLSKESYDFSFSLESMCPPIVNINDILSNSELEIQNGLNENIGPGSISSSKAKVLVVRSVSSGHGKGKETFL